MRNVCGKHFNPSIPSNAKPIIEELKSVNLCIYVTPSSRAEEAKICETVKKASLIWCNNCNFILNVEGISKLDDANSQLSDQGLSVEELKALTAESIISAAEINSNKTAEKLVNNFEPIPCSSIPFIIVYYIGGRTFQSGEDGFARFDLSKNRYVIVLTDTASPEVLAHEVGHILFSKFQNGNDPGPNRDPQDKTHNKSEKNLMHHTAPNVQEPITENREYISSTQCEVASSDPLVQEKKFIVGFKTTLFTYLITFHKIHVHYSNDGVLDSTLEATLYFNAFINNNAVVSGSWTGDLNDSDLNEQYLNVNLFAEIEEAPTDTIRVQIGGHDDDEDDLFPEVEQTFGLNEKWGTILPPNGTHSLKSRRNSNIEYTIYFSIKKIASRDLNPVKFDKANYCFKNRE
ncbi:hypothetical protein V7127_23280 [Bacillus sp. JJ1773]|uniref:hypothetical protein n=1 Tax=Bacillus sp. JJ1773 TaxID=3122965 RepID=UPI003000DFF5